MNKTLVLVLVGVAAWYFLFRKPKMSGGGPVPEGTYV